MVCQPCRDGQHGACPEKARQRRDLTVTERAASALCDCQHEPRTATVRTG